MELHLKDKRALVAGASRGLGYAVGLLLAREGCKVAINGRDPDRLKAAVATMSAESGSHVLGFAGDVSDPSVPAQLVGCGVLRPRWARFARDQCWRAAGWIIRVV